MITMNRRPIGENHPCYIVAEIGINHNGDIDTAIEMIRHAAECGVDAVKFQKRTPALAVPKSEWDKPKSTPWGDMTYLEYKERLEFWSSDYRRIDSEALLLGIEWFASVWDVESVDFLAEFVGCVAIKVPSAKITDGDLMLHAAHTALDMKIPFIISTGMSTETEIKEAIYTYSPEVVYHCTSAYPCKLEHLNLSYMERLRTFLPKDSVLGYSGHETGLATTLAAVVMGAKMVERHFTLDRAMWGTDHAASVEPTGMRRLVKDIRAVEAAMGDGIKRVYDDELAVRAKLRGE